VIKLEIPEYGLTGKQIGQIVKAYAGEFLRFEKLERYYKNDNDIKARTMTNDKPNNKLAHSFCKYITSMATGYFMGKGIRYVTEDEEQKEFTDMVLDFEYEKDSTFEIAKEASKCGVGFELLYVDEKSELKTKKFGAREFIPIFSVKIGEFLEAAIRVWEEDDILIDGKTVKYAELYTKTEIITYIAEGKEYAETERKTHNLNDVPVIVYMNNEEIKGDFEDVISIVDAYDKAQSDTANDFEYFTDAYMVTIGANFLVDDFDGNDDKRQVIKQLRNNRILEVDKDGSVEWLVKNVNDAATENYKNRLRNDMFFLAQVPALTDENFSQNVSGVAIKYKLIGLEELSIVKENKFRAAVKKKLKIVTGFINERYNKSFGAGGIEIVFDRNLIDNLTEIIENVKKLEGITSKETQLGLLPFVDDPAEEAKRALTEQYAAEHFEDASPMGEPGEALVSANAVTGQVEETAGKQLNGAQTQSLITVIGQYSAGAITLGQAINIISVAIGVSRDEAKNIIEGLD
jgi:SPP1 family phage portal protein